MINVPDEIKRIATLNFSYVNINMGRDILLCGGQYADDKTCSMDTFLIKSEETSDDDKMITDKKAYMKQPRMHHSMIYIHE